MRDTSVKMRQALLVKDWDAVGETLKNAHPQRKRLSPYITTPHQDEILEEALATCAFPPNVSADGAGAGRAFFCEDGRKADVGAALRSDPTVEVLDWNLSVDGLTLKVTE
jgi:galactokinase/mevalonate kinase-like predicted kinase